MNQDIRKLVEKHETDRNVCQTSCYSNLCCLKSLWDRFEDVPVDKDECIEENFHIWEEGTERFYIWHWLCEKHGIHQYGSQHILLPF